MGWAARRHCIYLLEIYSDNISHLCPPNCRLIKRNSCTPQIYYSCSKYQCINHIEHLNHVTVMLIIIPYVEHLITYRHADPFITDLTKTNSQSNYKNIRGCHLCLKKHGLGTYRLTKAWSPTPWALQRVKTSSFFKPTKAHAFLSFKPRLKTTQSRALRWRERRENTP